MSRSGPRRRSLVVAILLTALAIVSLDVRSGFIGSVGGAVREGFGILASGVSLVVRPVTGTINGITNARRLNDEIAGLKAENARLSKQVRQSTSAVREAQELRRLLALAESAESEVVDSARVILASPNSLERVITIDSGSSRGVKAGFAVLSPEGLVGIVEDVTPNTATVRLITDNTSAVGVRVAESGETGILRGTGRSDGLMRLELVSRRTVEEGLVSSTNILVTAGFSGGAYPPGIPVGQVVSVDQGARGGDARILVRPAAGLSRLEFVSVVRPGAATRGSSSRATPRP